MSETPGVPKPFELLSHARFEIGGEDQLANLRSKHSEEPADADIQRGLETDWARLEVLDHLNADEKASWQFIVGRESVTSPVLMKEMGFDERKAQRVLKALLDSGLLRRVGRGPATRYEVVRP